MPVPTRPKPSPAFVALRFRIQRAARADKRLSSGQYRILDYVLNETWPDPETGMPVARVTDEMLTDDVPGHAAQSTLYRTRTHIAELGWWSVAPGKGTAATVYTFHETPVKPILVALKASDDRRKLAALERRTARKNGTETLQSQHTKKRGRPRKIQVETLQNATHQNDENAGIYLSLPYQDKALPKTVQDMAIGVPAPAHDPDTGEVLTCEDCGKPAVTRCCVTGEAFCEKHRRMATRHEPELAPCIWCGRPSIGLNGAGKPACRSHLPRRVAEALAYRTAAEGE